MRTKALICAAALLAAGVATSMAQNVYSLNVVGYVQQVVPAPNQYIMIANPVTNTSVANTVGNLIGTALPVNGKILKWNYAGQHFDIYTRVAFGNGWNPTTGAAQTINPGEGFFLFSPSIFTNTFVGEVYQSYSANSSGPLTNSLPTGYRINGNLVPVSNSITALSLNIPFSASFANKILKWNTAGQHYDIFTRIGFGSGWNPSVPSIDVGEGFFTSLGAQYDWIQNFTVQ